MQERRLLHFISPEGDKVKMGPQFRELTIDRAAIDKAARTAELSFSSDTPYDRWWGSETLSHDPGAVDLTRLKNGGALLLEHDRNQQIGVVEKAWVDGKGRATVRFSKSAKGQEVFQDVQDGIRTLVSVGYSIDEMKLVSTKDDTENYLVTKWTPYEISIVSVPADPSVGVGRSDTEQQTEVRIVRGSAQQTAQAATRKEQQMNEATAAAGASADVQVMSNATAVELDRMESDALQALGIKHGIDPKIVRQWCQTRTPIQKAAEEVMRIIAQRSKDETSISQIGLSAQETRRYSMMRAIQSVVDKNWNKAGLEAEASRAIAQKLGKVHNEHTFFVPMEIQQRDLVVGTNTMGGYLVSTGNIGFIELLRNRSVMYRMGATRLSGLQGSVTIPKQTSPGTGYWLTTEATAATESQLVIGQLPLSPKNVAAYTEISRQLLIQGSPDAEMLVQSDLAAVLALAVDVAALTGTGAPQPTGIVATSGIGTVTITTGDVTYANILSFQTTVAASNALDANSGFVTTPAIAGFLKGKQRFSSTDTPLWVGNLLDGQVDGNRGMSSVQVTAGQLLFGDFTKVVIGEWGVLEVEVNPYANFAAGIVGVRAFYSCDVGVRYPAAFALGTGITK
jgi:HK97 family phage major capsid protein/HK97 family phage prohead protease